MTEEHPGQAGGGAHGSGPGYEARDVNVRAAALAGAGLILGAILSLAAMGWVFKHYAAREAATQPPPSTLAGRVGGAPPPEPRLQTAPVEDLLRLHASEEALLTGYAWVDRKAGIVRIPIERAIDLLAERAQHLQKPGDPEEKHEDRVR